MASRPTSKTVVSAPRLRWSRAALLGRVNAGLRFGPGSPAAEVPARAGLDRRATLTRRLLASVDALGAVVAVLVILVWVGAPTDRPLGLALLAPLIVAIHKVAGVYDRDELVIKRSTLDELPKLLQLAAVFTLLVAASSEELFSERLGPQRLVVLWGATTILVVALRRLARAVAHAVLPAERCLVIGDTEHVQRLVDKLARAHAPAEVVASTELTGTPFAGPVRVEWMHDLVERHDIHRVIIAPLSRDSAEIAHLVRAAKAAGVRVSILPGMLEAVGSAVEFEQIDGMTVLGVRRFRLTRSSRSIKRAFDLMVGTLGFIAVAPILAVLAVAVRLDSAGPIFFRQIRIGLRGKPFEIWKFRSMVVDADSRKTGLRELNEAGGGMFKIADDPRVTRVGRLLRKTSLDELPQIFNVLTGDMSLVGPRPLVIDEDALIEGLYRVRLHLTPGMTGPWQILGSTRVPMDEMVGIDYLYVANWSLWEDVKILVRTIPHVLARRGL